jgi:hypothetical protein
MMKLFLDNPTIYEMLNCHLFKNVAEPNGENDDASNSFRSQCVAYPRTGRGRSFCSGFPCQRENAGDEGHARRRPAISKIRIATTLQLERSSSLGTIAPERASRQHVRTRRDLSDATKKKPGAARLFGRCWVDIIGGGGHVTELEELIFKQSRHKSVAAF